MPQGSHEDAARSPPITPCPSRASRHRWSVVPFRPLDGVGCCFFDVRRCEVEALAESSVVNDERLLPLIEHLGKLAKKRDEDRYRLDDPARELTHVNAAV